MVETKYNNNNKEAVIKSLKPYCELLMVLISDKFVCIGRTSSFKMLPYKIFQFSQIPARYHIEINCT